MAAVLSTVSSEILMQFLLTTDTLSSVPINEVVDDDPVDDIDVPDSVDDEIVVVDEDDEDDDEYDDDVIVSSFAYTHVKSINDNIIKLMNISSQETLNFIHFSFSPFLLTSP